MANFCAGTVSTVSDDVEIGRTPDGSVVVIRRAGDSPALEFTNAEWSAFVAGVKNGEFDPE